MPYAEQLRDSLAARRHAVVMCTHAQDIPRGDIACFLSCERIVAQEILDRNRHNLVVHESALPHGRGWSPLTWQILEGKYEIPITLFEAVSDCDAGPIYFQDVLQCSGHELVDELRAMQGTKTIELIARFVDAFPNVQSTPQVGAPTTYPRRSPKDSILDPEKTIAEQFHALRVADNDRYPAFFELHGHQYDLRIAKRTLDDRASASSSHSARVSSNQRVIAVLQARTSSSRLPGKVLKPILGVPMLARQIERIRRSKRIDQLVIATSTDASDDALVALCDRLGVLCYRGSLVDVLDRCYHAVAPHQPTHVVRLTGDCPLIDPTVIDSVIAFAIRGDFDYATNAKPYTFPDGLDVEVVRFAALAVAWKEADLPSHREHVLPFIHRQPERFYLGYYRSPVNLSQHRWTIDEPDDLIFVRAIYEMLYPANPNFRMQDVLNVLAHHPELCRVNERFERNAGRRKALEEDTKFFAAQRTHLSAEPVCPSP